MNEGRQKPEGVRERKRRETLQRIADVGLQLFLANGYQATTLDDVARAAGVSRRTFFSYFNSKDEILFTQIGGYAAALRDLVREQSSADSPIDVASEALLQLSNRFQAAAMIAIARVMRDSEAFLRGRRHSGYLQLEQALYEGLSDLWPGVERRDGLRLVAMASVCALRLATDAWLANEGARALPDHLKEAFGKLKEDI
jgi:AcrR family transcriptional regulator